MRVASLKRVGLCWCVAWPLRGRSCARYGSTRESDSICQLSLQSKFLPSFWERYSPPNPDSASIGRNLGWRNSDGCPDPDLPWQVRYEEGRWWLKLVPSPMPPLTPLHIGAGTGRHYKMAAGHHSARWWASWREATMRDPAAEFGRGTSARCLAT